ncbi:uncharacterized protein LOC143154094 [Ptiloglossa arizonensis]|uniref:uncharacterized protein LOC143154094 n=1 Tax=Ptiloglossa arizonensis TaxID=3350558 RepID=UPI003F9EDF56
MFVERLLICYAFNPNNRSRIGGRSARMMGAANAYGCVEERGASAVPVRRGLLQCVTGPKRIYPSHENVEGETRREIRYYDENCCRYLSTKWRGAFTGTSPLATHSRIPIDSRYTELVPVN